MTTPLETARGYLGTKEVTGPADNPKIMEMYKTIGQDWVEHDEMAWCAAFVGHCLETSGVSSTRKLNARSYLAWGEKVPLQMPSEVFYADARLDPGASLPLPDDHEDRGVYVLDGSVICAGETYEAGRMLVFRPGDRISVKAGAQGARLMVLGGATMDGPRYIWWNFVASSRDRLDAAREAWRAGDWQHGRFRLPPGDEGEWIPAPER